MNGNEKPKLKHEMERGFVALWFSDRLDADRTSEGYAHGRADAGQGVLATESANRADVGQRRTLSSNRDAAAPLKENQLPRCTAPGAPCH